MSARVLARLAVVVLVCSSCTAGPAPDSATTAAGGTAGPTSAAVPPTTTTTVAPVTTFSEAQGAAVAIAAVQPFDNRPSLRRFTDQLTLCHGQTFGFDPSTTRVLISRDEAFSSDGDNGHPLQSSASAVAPYPDEATAEAKTSPAFAALSTCVSDEKQRDGSTPHVVGSPLAASEPMAGGVKIVATGVDDSKKPDYTVSFYGRIHNLLVACQAGGLDEAAAERSSRACLDAAGRSALAPATLPRTGRDTVVDADTMRTAVARTTLDGFTLVGAPLGYAQVCVTAPQTTTRRDAPPALSLGFAPPGEVDDAFPPVNVLAVPFADAGQASARIAEDAGLADGCVGQLKSPDPKFVPTFATSHGVVAIGDHGVFTTHEERYPAPTGTTFYASEATRLGTVVLYVQARGTTAEEARTRADLGLAGVARQLNAD